MKKKKFHADPNADTSVSPAEPISEVEAEQTAPEETPPEETARPSVETNGQSDKADYEPRDGGNNVNDPELLVGPYKPKEGEPPTIKCPNCGEEMPTTIDTCVNCGHYLKTGEKRYKMMDEAKARRIRWTLGAILIVAFIIYMAIKGAT